MPVRCCLLLSALLGLFVLGVGGCAGVSSQVLQITEPDVQANIRSIVSASVGNDARYHWGAYYKRNSAGTCLRMAVSGKDLFLVWADGQTSRVTVPSPNVWLDDNNVVQAWKTRDVKFPESEYVLRDGTVILSTCTTFNMVPSGRFFVLAKYAHDERRGVISNVYSTSAPLVPILRMDQELELFEKGGLLYVFYWQDPDRFGPLFAHIYDPRDSAPMVCRATVRIKPPSWLFRCIFPVDLSPFADEVLLINGRDELGSKYYIFNFTTRKMRSIGRVKSNEALFLADPLIARLAAGRASSR